MGAGRHASTGWDWKGVRADVGLSMLASVETPLPPGLLPGLGRQPRHRQAGGFGVELGVGEGPEMAYRACHRPLQRDAGLMIE